MRGFAIAALSLAACSSATGDNQPPTLEVTSPVRGTTADSHAVTVTGIVTDDQPGVRVTVNGTEAIVNNDGTFSATLAVEDGITLLETHAIDKGAADVRDVRAVLAGTLSPTDGSTSGAIGARVGSDGFTKVGNAVATAAQGIDFQALALGMNPIYNSSGCNSAKIDIQELTVGKINVGLAPKDGAVGAAVTIDDVYVKMHVNFRAICISGSTTVQVRSTRAHVNGDLALGVTAGKLAATLPSSAVALDGFSIDIGGVPGAIESLVRGEVRKAAEKALDNVIKAQVPSKASDALGGLLAQPIQTAILSKPTTFTITPSAVTITPDGMLAAVDAKVLVTGGEGGMFVSSPSPMTATMFQSNDLGIAIADDLLNQLFSGLWASGAISPSISLDGPAGILGAVLDPDARSIAIDMKLPPVVRAANGVLELAVGDLIMSVRNEAGVEVQQFALSLTTTLSATPTTGGQISVTLGAPTVKAQVISQVTPGTTTDDQLEGIVNGAWGVGGMMGDALANVPMPSMAGMQVGAPSLAGRDGFLVVDVPIQ